jgi:toxin YoeB
MFKGFELVKYQIVFTKQAQKDAEKIKKNNLKDKVEKLLEILKEDPYKNPPGYEKLVGDLKGTYSRRINIQHRLVYQIYDKEKTVKIIRMWTHYE